MNMMKARFALLILAGMTTMAGCASTESLYAQYDDCLLYTSPSPRDS